MNIQLGACLIPQSKSKVKAGEGLEEGPYRFYTSSPVQNKYYNEYQYDGEALIFGTGGNASVHYCEGKFATSTDCIVMVGENDVNLKLIYYYLLGNIWLLEYGFKGAGLKHISKDYILRIQISLPDRESQDEMVKVLDKINVLIAKSRQILDKLDDMVKGRFVEMFGDETEEKWPYISIGEVADVCVGVVVKPTQYYAEDGIPAFRSLNIEEMKVRDSDWVYFTKEGHQKNKKSIVQENDVLVVRSGAPGTACVATKKYDGYNAVDIIIAHPDLTMVDPIFLAEFTNMPHGKRQIIGKIGGAAQQHFNVSGYKSLQLILPPLDLQNQFSDFVTQVDKSKVVIQKSIDNLQLLFDSLMQQYFG